MTGSSHGGRPTWVPVWGSRAGGGRRRLLGALSGAAGECEAPGPAQPLSVGGVRYLIWAFGSKSGNSHGVGLWGLAGRNQKRLTWPLRRTPPTPQVTGQMPALCPLGLCLPYLLDFHRPWALLQSFTEADEARGLQLTLPEAEKGQWAGRGSERAQGTCPAPGHISPLLLTTLLPNLQAAGSSPCRGRSPPLHLSKAAFPSL